MPIYGEPVSAIFARVLLRHAQMLEDIRAKRHVNQLELHLVAAQAEHIRKSLQREARRIHG